MSARADPFDTLYRAEDPWGYRTRWYEARKRALTLAALDRPRFRHGLELGCSIGELTAALATRCARITATDAHPEAVKRARLRVADLPQVEILAMRHPGAWPDGCFDLLVVSEIGYYLSPEDLDATAARMDGALAPDGLVLACHWRRPIHGCALDGDAVHARLDARLGLPGAFRYADHDLVLEGWSRRAQSVAQREGLA